MSEWALPWEAGEQFDDLVKEFEQQDRFEKIKPFIKGGIWRNFLFKYNESNWMQKKMLHLSDRLDAICPKKLSKIQQQIWQTAREHLWRSMCNCAYWHGIFGGLYLPHLRHAVYVELLSCEARLNQLEYHNGFVSEELDVDGDGEDEILITFGDYHCAFVPHNGAILVELSLLDKHYNVLNSLQRYKEAYHRKVLMAGKKSAKGSIHENIAVKEEGLAKYLKYDLYPRKNLIDHIIKPSVTLEQFRNCEYYEDSDLIAGRYDYEVNKRGKSICFTKDGWINWQPVFVQKEIFFLQRGLKIRYRFKNTGTQPNSFRFGPEFNFAMLGGNTPDRFYQQNEKRLTDSALNSSGILEQSNALSVVNDWDKFMITIKTTENADFWRFPIETVSLSEAGFERVYQSSVVVPFFSVYLIPEESRSIELELLIKSW
jgi:alpha-amylase